LGRALTATRLLDKIRRDAIHKNGPTDGLTLRQPTRRGQLEHEREPAPDQ
jgi:hypothetical protein